MALTGRTGAEALRRVIKLFGRRPDAATGDGGPEDPEAADVARLRSELAAELARMAGPRPRPDDPPG